MKVLMFAGAGTSVELGVPAMVGMATEFRQHCQQWNIEPVLVDQLLGSEPDIEHLLEGLDQVSSARATLESIGGADVEFERIDRVRAEVEWFVQHAAERVVGTDAHLLWGPTLRARGTHALSIVTTNYDRAIELAANAEKLQLDDGFGEFSAGDISVWTGFGPDGVTPKLVKLHGSTDWYADSPSGNPVRLRHPMPLFGRAQLRLRSGQSLESALVLPSREKVRSRAPYQRLTQTFLNATDECELGVFIGTSMRDAHIRDAARAIAARCPVFVVAPNAVEIGLDGGVAIAQRASMFLMSTLPSALRSADPVGALHDAAANGAPQVVAGLADVRGALDVTSDWYLRCDAIERLDSAGLCLDLQTISPLLVDSEEAVSRYALGLVPQSPDRTALLSFARSVPHSLSQAFKHDLEILGELVEGRVRPPTDD